MKPKGLGIVTTQAAPQAIGPYSQAVVVDATVYTAGQIALDPQTGEVVGKTAAEQTERVLQNLTAVLEAAGSGLGMVVKTTRFLPRKAPFSATHQGFARNFGEHKAAYTPFITG